MQILERDEPLEQLRLALGRIEATRTGRCVLVAGEAGIGKTTLVQGFVRSLDHRVPVLQCGCEALFTPRPLGPLVDLAAQFPPSVELALQQGQTYNGLFPALLRFFRDAPRPQVLVVEDVHWADAGTLDLLRYLGRRLHDVPLLLLLTHRRDGLDAEHPLRRVLGDLPSASTLRIELAALSPGAVERLAQAAQRHGAEVYAATGGHPFYVAEVLASPDAAVPPSVRDAVLAELARASAPARALANLVSLFPNRVERGLLGTLAAVAPEAVDECLRTGLLVAQGAALSFRHEIARSVVHEAMPAPTRLDGHAAICRALSGPAAPSGSLTDIPRRMHHAEAAGLQAEVAALAPQAARQAAAAGDHREAARLYGLALQSAAGLDTPRQAELLEARAHALMLTNRHRDAIDCLERARAIHAARGEVLREGVALRSLARLHWFERGGGPVARRLAEASIRLLESLPPSRELALAYSTMSHLNLVGEDMAGAQLWGLRAIELAEAVDDPEALSHALNNVGAARLRLRDDAVAWGRLHRSLELALEHGLEQDAARAYNNLFILSVVHHDFELGLTYAEEGIAYCEARGLDLFTVRIRIRRAFARIVMGQWTLADADLAHLAQRHTPSPMEAATGEFVASVLALRRGAEGAPQRLAAAVAAMLAHRVEIWFITTAATLAEAAWLAGDAPGVETVARPALAQMLTLPDRWRSGELAAWLQRAGYDTGRELGLERRELPTPYALELAGDWEAAAAHWKRLGCPYDRALALVAGDEAALREAIVIFDALGAAPAAQRVRQLLRERGVRGVPRGPQPRTRDDPLGLTARERQVFELARQGLASAEIAHRLRRSERTVEHHLAAVYRKLGVGTRAALMARYPAPAEVAAAQK